MPVQRFRPMTKDSPTLDCDANIVEPARVWGRAADQFTKDVLEALKSTMWKDTEERLIQELPHSFEKKIVWGSQHPHHDTTCAWDATQALTHADVERPVIARMMGGNATEQFSLI